MTPDVEAMLRSRVRDVPDFPLPGVMFKDITPLLADPPAFKAAIDALAGDLDRVDAVVGIEARGFVLAAALAYSRGAAFVPMRKQGKLPSQTFQAGYALEYGDAVLEVHRDGLRPGERVLVVDDVLATGGTLAAAATLVRQAGAELAGVSVLLELSLLGGRERFAETDPTEVHAVLTY